MDGLLCLNKSPEMTSFLCCAILRHLLGEKKIGHAGTLDPNATGVLPILVGRATKLLDYLPVQEKRYTATLQFGKISDTLDVWGHMEDTDKPIPSFSAVSDALSQFRGDILQVPPMTSALKKDGVRLYELARKGQDVEREARPVTVHLLEALTYDESTGILTLDCRCSKGTYIRSICDDLGRVLGCGAVMASLCRTESAGYSLADCRTLDEMRELAENGKLTNLILPPEQILSAYPKLAVSPAQAVRFRNGGGLALDRLHPENHMKIDGFTRVYAPDGTFLGLAHPEEGELRVDCLFAIG